ncbi:MAG: DUF1843 domain-containing protein [Acidobacteriaceae bacterium]|nr:DUF1843 domain-containing protein [Acidobacteriaceae bacterium]MBV9037265.1 DUF1843 domain-containing protein [Acidobacteriaceae bacterium]MBV9223491.1 DUF1843 domain-containing protein [Acidobacteriaceae bacterium]MBV9307977.1 DUF1843 domain-containing protein [Acidobacteriaceae bacterium]MBV9674770.1 DUF1843 domain-containing protein [Acidobacteriaceae bacterium]
MQHVVLYGVVMQRAIASGNLQEMKKVAQQAEEHLKEWGDVRASLEHLKIEIAKLEHKQK